MKEIEISGANRFDTFTRTRAGSRAVIVRDGKILLTYETGPDWWLIPGGGLEEGETPEECCIREAEEETGYMIRPLRQFLTLYEYYEEYRYISHYFVCEVTGKGRQRLTDAEKSRGVGPRWLDLQEAVGLFSRHRDYAAVSEEKRGAYLREYTALREYLKPRAALRKMTGAEFQRFREYSISDYAADLAKGEGLDLERAEETAEKEFLGMLPDGPDTENQFVMSVEDAETGRQAGRIWFCFEDGDSGRKVFLCDFLIFENERRKGYARAALGEMERMARAGGCAESALYVWEHNTAGCSLYRACGYSAVRRDESGIYMRKAL